jgi:hypothetical protein
MGVSGKEGLAGLDYVGALLITPGVVLTLVGNIYTVGLIIKTIGIDAHILIDIHASTDKMVLVPLIVGLGLIVVCGFWETFSNTKYKLCPPYICK